ncbi:UNVERIFIED_CONTAM: hypothetical protein Sradi_3842300 [Sesamum radiatum]|uniref:Reverse transcriptase domain-containing protein n=1 Tax=Sesamum radiatum TaxID=300843 RepID=A0AAW2Q1G3_SESRA
MLSGQKYGYFHSPVESPSKGPPIPVFFLFCPEVLSSLISSAKRAGELKGMAISNGGLWVSHLLFADDTLIFYQATTEAMGCIKRILKTLEAASGLQVNLEKSFVVLRKNFPIEGWEDIAGMLGVRVKTRHDKYLDMPVVVGQSKREVLLHLKYRVWTRLQSWKCKNLSQAGKAVLLKSIIHTMPTYLMSCFLFPVSICHEIEGLMVDFFWHNKRVRKIHWIAWNKRCARREAGGLGFRKVRDFNLAILAKQL